MRYPVAIEPGTAGTAFGVAVPGLPGCFSAGDALGETGETRSGAIALLTQHRRPKRTEVA